MSLLVPLYAFVTWILWRGRTPTRLLFASFIAIFGFFMVAPRMHERYIYPAIALSVPLALEAPEMMAVFVIVSLTALINLAYILHTLNTVVFLNGRDGFAMATSALNVVALGTAVYYGFTGLQDGSGAATAVGAFFEKFAMPRQVEDYVEPDAVAPPWIATDTIIISALLIVAACTRFYHLGHPAEIVFDEVHFVAQGRHYLHGESFLDPHPPLAKLIIAAGIAIFGDHPWGWRVGNATLGTAIVGITYLLGRRMSGSRLTGALAGGIILLDGMYLVDSHYAVIDIVYLTCAAVSYLLFFKFLQTRDAATRRRILPWIGLTLGLTLASKLYIPAITFLLVLGFILYVLLKERPVPVAGRRAASRAQGDEGTADCLEVEEVQAGGATSATIQPVGIDLYDTTSTISIALICIVVGALLFFSGATAGYIVLTVVAVLALRIGEILWRRRTLIAVKATATPLSFADLMEPKIVGAFVLIGAVASITYIAVWIPHYYLGWWGGISDLFHYYKRCRLVREERFERHPSVRVAVVELAADAASDRVLAKLSEDGSRADGLGRRQSCSVVGRADRHHDHRRCRLSSGRM